MQSQRGSTLLGLFHIISLLVVTSTAAVIDAGRGREARLRRRRSDAAEPPPLPVDHDENCRCAAEQWEGVLRSVDREFYLTEQQADSDRPASHQLGAAEMESNTAIHYDFRNSFFASQDLDSGVKTIIDYNIVGCAHCI